MPRTLVLGTRASALALWQAHYVRDALTAAGWRVQIREITTRGDQILDVPLAEIGGKGLFTKELDLALLDGRIDLAVHSLKDLPTTLPEGLALAAVTERHAVDDAFVAHPDHDGGLDDLPHGARVATSSRRRGALLKAHRPDLEIVSVRGNVGTRLNKLDASDWGGMILAAAGLERLGLAARIRERLPRAWMVPAVGQGALGVVCAAEAEATREALREALDHTPTRQRATAERAFLGSLEGGCAVPIGGHAWHENGALHLDGCVAALDGATVLRAQASGDPAQAEALGHRVADMLAEQGAHELLQAVRDAADAP